MIRGTQIGRCVPLLLAVLGCNGSSDSERTVSVQRLPRLELVVVHDTVDGPASTHTDVVVGDSGEILFHPPSGSGSALAVLARDGSITPVGGEGQGPGEALMPLGVEMSDSRISAFDLAAHRVLEWSRDGRLRTSWHPPVTAIPFAYDPQRGFLATRSRREGLFPVLLMGESGTARDLVTPSDTFYRRLFPPERTAEERLINPTVIGHWRGGPLVADGLTYRIGLYDWDGELVSVIAPDVGDNLRTARRVDMEIAMLRRTGRRDEAWLARERERLSQTPIRWFTHLGPPAPDGQGRLWVLGQHQDSGFADVFHDGAFLGRHQLACDGFAGRWDVRGEWLVLMCTPDDQDSRRDAVAKVYRLVN